MNNLLAPFGLPLEKHITPYQFKLPITVVTDQTYFKELTINIHIIPQEQRIIWKLEPWPGNYF